MRSADEFLAAFDPEKLHLTSRQAQVWTLRAQGVSQSKIAKHWGTSRANVCMLERAARRHIARARETVVFDELLRAPLAFSCKPGELLLDIPARLYRHAQMDGLRIEVAGPVAIQRILEQVPECVRDNRLVRPILLWVTCTGELWARSMRHIEPCAGTGLKDDEDRESQSQRQGQPVTEAKPL